ncbi:hypothetical protein PVAND_000043 [Polypedilum vanderplanki]|uniref:Cytochrome P450 n=1 Tax=Polypedilum vanderplanki TaxID=319348 RepID=A0A9J6BIV4_POLVA|nr:hypothetical protein PVAND_000043 [Polypedilum vanderplanki]
MILTLILVSLLTIFVYIKSRYNFWSSHGFPSAKAKFLIGNLDGVGRSKNTAQKLKEIYDEFQEKEDFVGIYLLISPAILILKPEIIRLVLVKDFSNFSDRGMYYNKKDDPLSANLLTMRVEEWKPMRTKITPTFSTAKIKTMFDIVSNITDNLVDKLSTSDVSGTNITETIAAYSTDVISNIAFGISSNCLADPNSEIRKYSKLIFAMSPRRLMKFFISSQFPKFAAALGFTSTNKIASDYFMKLYGSIRQFQCH